MTKDVKVHNLHRQTLPKIGSSRFSCLLSIEVYPNEQFKGLRLTVLIKVISVDLMALW